MKFRWRNARRAAQAPLDRPNIVMGGNVQVCWEKFSPATSTSSPATCR